MKNNIGKLSYAGGHPTICLMQLLDHSDQLAFLDLSVLSSLGGPVLLDDRG